MPTAALSARDRRDVDPVVAGAQRNLSQPVAVGIAHSLAHERGDRGALDRAQMVDDALGVALLGARLDEVDPVQLGYGQPAAVVALDVGQPAGQ